ncbi:site-specific integrase [Tsukamurella soli]|uniref:Tyr recombinase domain-containing protein n=1 Tax=Tsukamurella soli TaxID=644556 RepID=A0ABP8JE44_9ACTN
MQRQPVYALAVTFSAYTGLRAGELRGLEIGDVTLPRQKGAMGMVSLTRTKTRQGGKWLVGTPKSVRSTRVVPIDGWLADDLRTYLASHPRRLDPSAPLFPGRMTRAEAKAAGVALHAHAPDEAERDDYANAIMATYKWTEPIETANVARNYYSPALAALDLPPARWHDLRHSFAVLSLSAGEHYMQVSKRLGHASFVTTLNVYADYISEAEGGKQAPLSRPTAVPAPQQTRKVSSLR